MAILNRILHIPHYDSVQRYLEELALSAAFELDVAHVLIAHSEAQDPTTMNTRVAVVDSEIVENFVLVLAGNFCRQTLKEHGSWIQADQARFSCEQDHPLARHSVQSTIAVSIVDSRQRTRGMVVVLDNKPIAQPELIAEMLDCIATRIALEFEREILEEERQRTFQRELRQERLQSLGLLAAGVAHDINNVLAVIRGATDVLKVRLAEGASEQELQPFFQSIAEAADRSAVLTEHLLAYGRKNNTESKPMLIRQVIEQAIEDGCAQMLAEHQQLHSCLVKCHHHLCSEPLLVRGDRVALEGALVQLVLNARDSMPHGGEIHISSAVSRFSTDHPELAGEPCVRIIIEDCGHGIPPHIRDHIFDPFFTTKDIGGGRGIGMGLSAVYGIIGAHDGIIQLYSQMGYGTAFHVCLPIANCQQLSIPSAENLKPIMLDDLGAILLLESDRNLRRTMAERLEKRGAQVFVASSLSEAKHVLDDQGDQIRAICIDADIPDQLAHESVEHIADVIESSYSHISLCLSSGFGAHRFSHRLSQRHADLAVLRKPFEMREMFKFLRSLENPVNNN